MTNLDTIDGPKSMKLQKKCVKNPRAPIGITPDACWHKHWPNNSVCTRNVSKRTTKLTKLDTIVDTKTNNIV